jgi:uncharacterized protein (TIGR03435 family)
MELLRSGGIGMKIEGGRVVIRNWALTDLISAAYRVRTDQIAGPDWIGEQRFDIQAVLPQKASPDQVPEMLQVLLADRFKLVARRGQKMMPVYALVLGKKAPTLQDSTDSTGPSGCAVLSGGHRACHHMTMDDLAKMLTSLNRMYLGMPPGAMTWGIEYATVDETGLTGAYDFKMDFGPGSSDTGGGPVIDAVERLGLKLDLQKRPNEFIFIDHLDRAPTEN